VTLSPDPVDFPKDLIEPNLIPVLFRFLQFFDAHVIRSTPLAMLRSVSVFFM
jgi:hypothetical protein